MRWRRFDDGTAVAVLAPGDEAIGELSTLVRQLELGGAQVTAVGAFSEATVGWFDRHSKQYRPIAIDEQCEVLSLVGDVALADDGPQLHLHAVLGLPDGSTRGGHLLEGAVWPTLEVVFRTTPAPLHKTSRPDLGIAVIELDSHPQVPRAASTSNGATIGFAIASREPSS